MPRTIKPASVTIQIQSLVKQRDKHAKALDMLDRAIEEIQRLVGSGTPRVSNGAGVATARRGGVSRRRRRGRFSMSGEETILQFVKSRGNPTTRDVNTHWKSEGRKGTADNALSKLVLEKRLKRVPMKGERGSRYQTV